MLGEAHALPSAERLTAEDQQGCTGTELDALFQQRVENVDLRLPLLDVLQGAFDARGLAARQGRGGQGRGSGHAGVDALFQRSDRLLNVREEREGVDICLNALESGFELRVDDAAHVFDGGTDLSHHPLDRFADVRIDRARDFLAPHGHKSSACYAFHRTTKPRGL